MQESLKIIFQSTSSECSRVVSMDSTEQIGKAIGESLRYCFPELNQLGVIALEMLLASGVRHDPLEKLHALAIAWDQWSAMTPFEECFGVSVNLSKLIGDSWADEDIRKLREQLESLGCRVIIRET